MSALDQLPSRRFRAHSALRAATRCVLRTYKADQAQAPATPPDAITTLNRAGFDEFVLQANGKVAVEFMSYGCAHCRALEPVLQQVANALRQQAGLFRVNIATESGLAETYGIEGTPTLVIFF